MNKLSKKCSSCIILLIGLLPPIVSAISISGTFQAWLLIVEPTVSTTYESANNQASIDVTATTGRIWRLDVQKYDSFWSSDFHLYCRRTTSGNGGLLLGGTSYQEITAAAQGFFYGWSDTEDINIQMRLTLMENTEPNTYSTTIVYTVVSY
jgi:hypothetical protein